IGLSPQETSTAGNLTVRENLILTAKLYGFRDAVRRADEIIERLGLNDYANRRSKLLSGGLRRRLSIGMGIVTEPKVLFLDEPTLGLDVLARRELWRFIEELKQSMTVVLTTHYMEEAERLSDKIAVMADGSVKAAGTLAELREISGCAPDASLETVFIRLTIGQSAEGGERV
ncbi:MAG: ATP-binding cassette domain-containing protein, partial [Ruminococcaceae bacterium]|nr:ATP-binding cassette domain-containing protein [Oscillospiraceae bacterium]